MDKNTDITYKWGLVGKLTFLSRIVGYARDMTIAYLFGASYQTDAFYVAFRIPNLLRRLFAEGSLTVAFVPVFTDYVKNKGKQEAREALNSIFTVVFFFLFLISLGGVILSPLIVKLFAFGFDKETYEITVQLNRIMFPYILFISIAALAMGVLNTLNHFFAPAFSPVLFNLTIICSAYFFYNQFANPVVALAVGVLIGGVFQVLINIPFLLQNGFMFRFSGNIFHPAVKRIAFLIAPQLFGLAVYNLNILVNTQFASYLPEGTVSYLYFSERLIEFPLGVVAVSLATVFLPRLSSDVTSGDIDGFRKNFIYMMRLMLFVMVPAFVGLIALRVPICSVLFQRGEFTYKEVVATSEALLGYALGLWAVGGIRVTVPAFYSFEDTKTPVITGFFSFIINAVLCYVLGFTLSLKHTGLALASSLSSVFNFLLLFYLINKRVGHIINFSIFSYFLKLLFLSFCMGLISWYLAGFMDWSKGGKGMEKLIFLFGIVVVSVGVYFFVSRIAGIEEGRYIKSIITSRKDR